MESTARLPDCLADLASEAERLAREILPQADAAVRDSLRKALVLSEFVTRQCRARPDRVAELAETIDVPSEPAAIIDSVRTAANAAADETDLMARLRRVRNRWMLRIAWRELAGMAGLEESLAALSALAGAAIDSALETLHGWHRERFGDIRDERGGAVGLIVLGMGKLGAGELNYSSDIDLIFVYAAGGDSDGPRPLSAEEYFSRLGRRLIRVLDEPTEDGFVFRVDMRLRPFGDSGPLVVSAAAMETYYQAHGREWERYALIKAAPVAGDRQGGEALLDSLRPFVYRRYLDFSVFDSLRDMKARIAADMRRRGMADNIKLGRGGIREIEFIGQAFQLVRGGREPVLQERAILPVLQTLAAQGQIETGEAEALTRAYRFLRRVENALQMRDDRQTHSLPEETPVRAALAWHMGFADWPDFQTALGTQRDNVHGIFRQIFSDGEAPPEPETSPESLAWADPGADDAADCLRQAGFDTPGPGLESLRRLKSSAARRNAGAESRRLLDRVMPVAIRAAADTEQPGVTLARLTEVLEAIQRRSTYLALLLEHPQALWQLTRMCAASDWIAALVARQPVLLDELIDPRIFNTPPRIADYGDELARMLANVESDDLEAVMNVLREFKQVSTMRVAAADIGGVLPLMRVSDHLSAIAEHLIARVLEIARRHLEARHGKPRCTTQGQEREAGFLVVAYGKLGGLELGYGSDLDLVFLHDSAGDLQRTDGDKPLENPVFFMRLTQRIIHLLSTPTQAGVLYEVDTRLRPSGSAGLLVSSLDAFARYQREQAWTWEHQALLRTRPVAGDPALREAFAELRRELLCRPRDAERLARDVSDMRSRLARERARTPGAGFDLKADAGGITDIEFLVQYWVLRFAPDHPDLVDYPDVIRFLDGLEIDGLVPESRTGVLRDIWREYRGQVHRQALKGGGATAAEGEFAARRRQVIDIWREVFGTPPPGAEGLV